MYELLYVLGGLGGGVIMIWWVVAAVVVGVVAGDKERSGVGYFLLALLLSPLFAGLVLAGATDAKLAQGIAALSRQLEAIRQQIGPAQMAAGGVAPLEGGARPEDFPAA